MSYCNDLFCKWYPMKNDFEQTLFKVFLCAFLHHITIQSRFCSNRQNPYSACTFRRNRSVKFVQKHKELPCRNSSGSLHFSGASPLLKLNWGLYFKYLVKQIRYWRSFCFCFLSKTHLTTKVYLILFRRVCRNLLILCRLHLDG